MNDDAVGDMLKTSKLADLSPQYRSQISVDTDNLPRNKKFGYEFSSPQVIKNPSTNPHFFTPNPQSKKNSVVSSVKNSLITSNTTLFQQREKHMQKLIEKQPMGRDGKRIPLKESKPVSKLDSSFTTQKRNTQPMLSKYGSMVMSNTKGYN